MKFTRIIIFVLSQVALLMSCNSSTLKSDNEGSAFGAEDSLEMANSVLNEIKEYYRGGSNVCVPSYGAEFDKDEVERIINYEKKDIFRVIDLSVYGIIFSFNREEKKIQLALDVSLKDGKCVGFSIEEVYVN